MKYGLIEGLVKGIDSVVFDYTVEGSAVSSISTGDILNGDEDGWYTIIARFISATNTNYLTLNFNGDTATNYGRRSINADNTTVANGNATGEAYMFFPALSHSANQNSFIVANMYAKAGSVRLLNFLAAGRISTTTVTNFQALSGVWNNTADNLTSMLFSSTNANGIAVGTRIIIIKGNNFTDGMKTGVINTSGIKNAWIRHDSHTLASPASSVSFTGLDGDNDVLYYVKHTVKSVTGGTDDIKLQINGDIGTNYGRQNFSGANTTVAANRDTNATYIYGALTGDAERYSIGEALIFAPKGFIRPAIVQRTGSIDGTLIKSITFSGCSWNNTADNITQISLSDYYGNNHIAAGSTFELYKLAL